MNTAEVRSVVRAVFGEVVDVVEINEDGYRGWDVGESYGLYLYDGDTGMSLDRLVRSPGGKYEPPSIDVVTISRDGPMAETLVKLCSLLAADIATNQLDILATDAQAKEFAEETTA